MRSFLEAGISRTKTFVVYGNLKDRIWCPDLMPRDLEHYLLQLLKSRGYRHVIFYGEAGTKGVYCLDEESARFFFSENMNVPLAPALSEIPDVEQVNRSSGIETPASPEQPHTQNERTTTGSQVSDALADMFGSTGDDEYRPGDISTEAETPQTSVPQQPQQSQQAQPPQHVRYAFRGQTMSMFIQKIQPLMLKHSSHMAVIFYNILTTDLRSQDIRDDILDIWENHNTGNICLMLFPETHDNEAALENRLRQSGLDSKFLISSGAGNRSSLNPYSCVKIGRPDTDEIKYMLRYLSMVGTTQRNKISLRYLKLDQLANQLLFLSEAYAKRTQSQPEYMMEIYDRICRYIDSKYQADPNWDSCLTGEDAEQLYNIHGLKPKRKKAKKGLTDQAADWAVSRIASEIPEPEPEETLEELQAQLNAMVGLEQVKREVKSLIAVQEGNRRRKEMNLPVTNQSLHMVFTGDPGTGKTTVARLIGKIYRSIGVLSSGHLLEVGEEDLVVGFVGQTPDKTRSVMERAQGGVLFIDEAYALSRDNNQGFGKEAIETMLRYMENHRDDLVVIVAGYTDKMKSFIESNEGLQSRFTKYIDFDSYSVDQLMEILDGLCRQYRYHMDDATRTQAHEIMRLGKKYGGANFGNGRYVRTVFETAISLQATRLQGKTGLTPEAQSAFAPEDFILPPAIHADLNDTGEEKSTEQLLQELDALVGLKEVKSKVHEMLRLQQYNEKCRRSGIPVVEQSLHMVFTGNPGTGKTVVARLIGSIYRSIGILPRGQLIEVKREDLVGTYVGHTEEKTKKAIQSAKGGILFIDEAYALANQGEGDFGQNAINTLLPEMENGRNDFMVIAAGYPDKMESFLASNPGLRSRFSQTIQFHDYSDDELVEIFRVMARQNARHVTPEAEIRVRKAIETGRKAAKKDFGNGRFIRNIFEQSIRLLASRVAMEQITDPAIMSTLIEEDIAIPKAREVEEASGEKTREELLEELDQMVGLQEVKQQVRKLINQVSMNKLRKKRGHRTVRISLHMVFTGNPGTGKTSVARLIGKLYKSIGVLPSGQLIEAGREDLVGQYIGHTAEKTKQVLERALGGVLFIDEAYTLSDHDSANDFGQEAIDTILRFMENNRDQLVVIVAGYTDLMLDFIKSNPGLRSRFSKTIHFKDYSEEQLMEILQLQCRTSGYSLTEGAAEKALECLIREKIQSGSDFGNGRSVRNIFEAAVLNQNDRISTLDDPSDEELMTLTAEDFT